VRPNVLRFGSFDRIGLSGRPLPWKFECVYCKSGKVVAKTRAR
jgi:hypothetical protein